MNDIKVSIYAHSKDLPPLNGANFFHSPELFRIIEDTQDERPYMAVATDKDGRTLGHMLAIIRRRGSLMPPYFFTQGRIYGEGSYEEDVDKETVFGCLLHELTRKFRRKLCLYAEFSDISQKMFGYRYFRKENYFPVHWQEVHNSLHSMDPWLRLSPKMRQRIERGYQNGVETMEATTPEESKAFYKLLNGFYRMKMRRIIPKEKHFHGLMHSSNAKIFLTTYRHKVIGGCACVYSEGNAYLWYLASRRKTYLQLHPDVMTVWQAIKYAYDNNYSHIYFLDVGLPFKRNPFRDFILSFGGKPVAKFRWFVVSVPWVNKLLSWWYSE